MCLVHAIYMNQAQHFSLQKRISCITQCASYAPILAQCIMFVVLLAHKQWLYATMVAAGCMSYAAIMLNRLVQNQTNEQNKNGDPEVHQDAPIVTPVTPIITQISLEQILGICNNRALFQWIAHQWWLPKSSLNVPIGMNEHAMMYIDLDAQGPHAIVAGTTGSGKSVVLQNWCLSLALHFSPQQLQFVLLDFKAGSAFDQLQALPHVRGYVNNLELSYATRALIALENELHERENLTHSHRVSDIHELEHPPADIVIVVDEYHALHDSLPDYMNRLVAIASLGRSLGMHVIACTQHPLGQISAVMKANMSLRLCLRVQDPLASQEMIGTQQASCIRSTEPGTAILSVDGVQRVFRSAFVANIDRIVEHIQIAAWFHQCPLQEPLFTPPLPRCVSASSVESSQAIALGDDGTHVRPVLWDASWGNIAIIGQPGKGKSTLLRRFIQIIQANPDYEPIVIQKQNDVHSSHDWDYTIMQQLDQAPSHCVWIVDDADQLLDPMNVDAFAQELRSVLLSRKYLVIMTMTTSRFLRIPDYCTTRIVFPVGEQSIDAMEGIPSQMRTPSMQSEVSVPGRAVLIVDGNTTLMQCIYE